METNLKPNKYMELDPHHIWLWFKVPEQEKQGAQLPEQSSLSLLYNTLYHHDISGVSVDGPSYALCLENDFYGCWYLWIFLGVV